jgi:3-keto-5-aminohexanoate cleavage enzyme
MQTLMSLLGGFRQVSRQNALKPQRLVPHGWGGATISGGLARELTEPNAEQVHKVRRVLEELGHEIATPAEAREMLALKGGDRVNF